MTADMAERLSELRRSKKLNQEELAEQLGVSRQAVSKWERGESQPDISNLVMLSELYGVSIDYLAKGYPTCDQKNLQDDGDDPSSAADASGHSSDSAPDLLGPEEEEPAPATPPNDETLPPPVGPPIAFGSPSADLEHEKPKWRKNPWLTFPYPLLVIFVYLICGMGFDLWHPLWVLFLTIPFYYWIALVIAHDPGTDTETDDAERQQGWH